MKGTDFQDAMFGFYVMFALGTVLVLVCTASICIAIDKLGDKIVRGK
jgi:hypothetical protein